MGNIKTHKPQRKQCRPEAKTGRRSAFLLSSDGDLKILQTILDLTMARVTVVDRSYRILRTYWGHSEETAEQWKDKLKKVKGEYCYNVYMGESRPCAYCPAVQTLRTGRSSYRQIRKTDKSGRERLFDAYANPLGDNGVNSALVIEINLHRHRHKDAWQLMWNDLVSYVSHELHTPLTVIKEGISIVLDEIAGKTNALQKECLNLSLNNVERLVSLMRQVVELSELEMGRVTFRRKKTDLSALLEKVKKKLNEETGAQQVNVTFFQKGDNFCVHADEEWMESAILHLLRNAIISSMPGREVILNMEEKDDSVQVCISDSGAGFNLKEQKALFEGWMGRGARQRRFCLNFTLSRKIIESHEGRIWMESAQGSGSHFYFKLDKIP